MDKMKENTNIVLKNQADNEGRFDALVGLPTINVNEITLGDSLELCERIPAKTVDLILEDMPYNTTACEWDVKIDLQLYWKTRLRILKPTGVICLSGMQPFVTDLINSNRKMFKYDWVWNKKMVTGFANVKVRPMLAHESILIFYNKPFTVGGNVTYNPQKREVKKPFGKIVDGIKSENYGDLKNAGERGVGYPKTILEFAKPNNLCKDGNLHPTQKPVGLFEYLIRTYSNEGDLVFDGFGGSGTTAIAAHKSKRNFIVIEKEKKYFDLAIRRLADERTQLSLL